MTTTTRRRRRALAALALAALLLGACGGGDDESASGSDAKPAESDTTESTTSEAPETTTTAAPTTTEAPATTEPLPETARYGFDDTFDGDTGWVTGCNDIGCAGIEDSYFYEDIQAGEKEIDQHTEWDGRVLYDVTVETGIVSFGAGNPEGGVVCFADPDADTYYDFTVGADGQGSLYRFDGSGGEALAGPFTVDGFVPESTIITGTCAYEADGSVRLTMAVNGTQVADVVDPDPLAPGEVGLISYGDGEELSTVHFELVSVEGSELLD
jgi:hypothetical protein